MQELDLKEHREQAVLAKKSREDLQAVKEYSRGLKEESQICFESLTKIITNIEKGKESCKSILESVNHKLTKCTVPKAVLRGNEAVRGKELEQKNIENARDNGSFQASRLLKGDRHQERMKVAYLKREQYRASVVEQQQKRKVEIREENLEAGDRVWRAKAKKMPSALFKAICRTFLMVRFVNECARLIAFSNSV